MFRIDRIDFIAAGMRCRFCSRELKSRVAFILRDAEGKECLCGPTCLSTHAKIDKSKTEAFPNFTKACLGDVTANKEKAPTHEPKKDGEQKARSGARKVQVGSEEIEYLVLRFRLLSGFAGMKIKSLEDVYGRYMKGLITTDDRTHLTRLIAKVRAERKEYSPENLSACYAYSHWIKIALQDLPAEKQGFLRQMLFTIYEKFYLSPGQATAVNRWLAKIEGMPALDPGAFVAAKAKQSDTTLNA